MRKNSFIQGALILTVAGIIVKFIGAFSRIYLSRLLGGEGIGLYQMAYPIYLLCLSVSSAGLPVAISIMVAERNAVNDYNGGQKVFRISMAALVMTGLFFSVLLFFGSQWLVDTGIVRDPRAYWSLLALSPAVFCAISVAGPDTNRMASIATLYNTAPTILFIAFFNFFILVTFSDYYH